MRIEYKHLRSVTVVLILAASVLMGSKVSRAAEFQAAIGHRGSGRCHMDYCSYFIIDSATPVGEGRDGTLFKIEERTWGAEFKRPDNAPDSYDEYAHPPTSVVAQRKSVSFVYCSKTRPATFDFEQSQGIWIASHLRPGDDGAIDGSVESAYAFYYAACHDAIIKGPYNADNHRLPQRLGYRFPHTENGSDQDNVAPRDMLK